MVKNDCLLFQPIDIGGVTYRNRIIMPAMDTSLGDLDGFVTDEMIAYYEERAKGGVGGIIVEYTSVEGVYGRQLPHQIRIDDDKYIPRLGMLARAIKKHGAVPFIQLHHAGRVSETAPEGTLPVAPSPIPPRPFDPPPRELREEEIEELVLRFVEGAKRARAAGFKGVEIHGAHIYLIHQFLSPKLNKRTDKYGGSVENRARFLLEIIAGIRKELGAQFPVWVRINGDDFEEGEGITLDEAIETAKLCEQAGATAIHVSAGGENWRKPMTVAPMGYPEGLIVGLAEKIKQNVAIPVIAVGKIRRPEMAEDILAKGKADMVAVGRALIADPYWPKKALENNEGEIAPCIGCNECLNNILYKKVQIACSVNPLVGKEGKSRALHLDGKKILVVGGGPAGLTAAIRAAEAGAEVVLAEKSGELGGLLRVADVAPHKEDLTPFLNYLIKKAEKLPIQIHLHTDVAREFVEEMKPDGIVIATGSVPLIPNITGVVKGMEKGFVLLAEDVLAKIKHPGKKVFIIGGELTACELGEYLADRGHEVTIGRRGAKFATKIEPVQRKLLLKRLEDKGAVFIANIEQYFILEDELILKMDGEMVPLVVDHVILAAGYQITGFYHDWMKELVPNTVIAGDAREVGNILTSVRDGWEAIDKVGEYFKEEAADK